MLCFFCVYQPCLINRWLCFAEFPPFSGLWLVEQFPPICRYTPLIGLSSNSQAWLTFGHEIGPWNSRCLLASDWLSSLQAFADKLLIRLSSHLVDQLTPSLPWRGYVLVTFHWIPVVPWRLICWVLSVHLRTNHWPVWAKHWWTKSLWASLGLFNFSCSVKFQSFSGLWLVEQLACICREAAIGFSLNLVDKPTFDLPWPN